MSVEVRRVRRTDAEVGPDPFWQPQLRCPGCGVWGDLDADQVSGQVSVECPECGFHETMDLFAMMGPY